MALVTEMDIWHTANLLLKQHSEDAAVVAARRADELLALGDVDGRILWGRIMRAIREFQRPTPSEGERLN